MRNRSKKERALRGRLRIFASAFVVILALALAVETAAQEKQKVFLPSLPPAWELNPGLYDKDGCLLVPTEDGGRKCGPRRQPLPLPLEEESLAVHRALRGFLGPNYAPQVKGTAVEVLRESLNVSATGTWNAAGLVRNETLENVGKVVVTAVLFGKTGELLENASAEVPVALLRPGEPGPFHLTASVDAVAVARVEWSVQAGSSWPNAGKVISRDFLVQTYWQMPYGVAEFRGIQRNDAPYPYVLAAGFRNLGGRVRDAKLVVAWLDSAGRVVWTEVAPLDELAVRDIPRDGAANFRTIEVFDPQLGPRLADLTQMMWVAGE